jgi:hypothetical protein
LASVAVAFAALGALASSASARPASSSITIVSIRALPPPSQRGGGLLTPGKPNVVFSAGFVSLRIEFRNGGASRDTHLVVKVVINRGTQGGPLVKTATLDLISSGQTTTVTLSHLGKVPFAMQTSLSIEVGGQDHVYPVVFASPD